MTEHEREKLEALEKRMDEILELIRNPEMTKDKKEVNKNQDLKERNNYGEEIS